MTSMIEKDYKTNPYVYDVVNAVSKFCRDYDDSQKALTRNPKDIRAALVRAYCMGFAAWMSETMDADFKTVGETLVRMMGAEDDEK